MTASYIILVRENSGAFSMRGHTALPMTRDMALAEVERLQRDQPKQRFAIFAEFATTELENKVTLTLSTPTTFDARAIEPMRARGR